MSEPRRKRFGPLLYTTLIFAVLVTAWVEFDRNWPRFRKWQQQKSLAQTVAQLAIVAGDPREETRLQAAGSLGGLLRSANLSPDDLLTPDLRSTISTSLIRLARDQSNVIREAAIEAMNLNDRRSTDDSEMRAVLVAATKDEDPHIRFAAARVLLSINEPARLLATDTMIALIADPNGVPNRQLILNFLMTMGEATQDRAIDALIGLLSQDDPFIRLDAVNCLLLFETRARAALPVLSGLLGDEDLSLRYSAALAMAKIGVKETPPTAVATLIELVGDVAQTEETRQSALEALREISPEVLSKASAALVRQLGDNDANVRLQALGLLSAIVLDARAEIPSTPTGE